jgi:hypothetical protein
MRRLFALALALAASCGPAAVPRAEPVATGGESPAPEPLADATPPEPLPPPPPCVASPPTQGSLARLGQDGVLVVDAAAPQHTGECVSPAAILRDGDSFACDPSGTRCELGGGRVLIAREVGDACVALALVTYDGEIPAAESEAVISALEQRREACALHDLVAAGSRALYEVDRVRQVAPDARGALTSTCVREVAATAAAEVARTDWSAVPLACTGLRCRDAGTSAPPRWLFANRISGPLRFDAVAVGQLPEVLAQLRQRCR